MEMQLEMLRTIISRYGATSVAAGQFFVSWNSVVTLAYTGFSRTLLAIKRGVQEGITGLQPENPGSRWPKTTLGCLREGVELSEDQVYSLRDICVQQSTDIQNLSESDRSMDINKLCCVTFHCRTLERRLATQVIQLEGRSTIDDSPPQSHLDVVGETMAQFSESEHANYYPRLASQGRTINTYYRTPRIESTLVYDLKPSAALADSIWSFCQAVDNALPGCYAWFDPNSWHMTVRALVSAN